MRNYFGPRIMNIIIEYELLGIGYAMTKAYIPSTKQGVLFEV